MARPRKITPDIMVLRMAEVISKILTMNDTEIGAWFRKAAVDVMNGCKDPNCDPLIRQQFERALQELQKRQEHNATMYRNRLARQGKNINNQETTDVSTPETVSADEASNPITRESETRGPQTDNFNGDATTREGVEVFFSRESGALEPTTISNISQDAPNGNAGDERRSGSNSVATVNLVHPAPIAESARCATSEAVKALADASTREGEDERDHRGNTETLESRSPAKTLTEARQSQARESWRTGGDSLRRVEKQTASHAETLPVRSAAEEKKPYGTCGHVMLTDTEGRHLREVYGEDLKIAIDILDAYIENNGKAAKRYKNHAAVLRKGNWVYNKLLEMKNNEQRLNNSKHQGDRRSFRQQDRDHQTELMHKSLFAPSLDINDKREIANG